jgi:hypothetical protein
MNPMKIKGKYRATPKGIDLIDKELLVKLKDAHRQIHHEIEDESEFSQNFVHSFEKFRDEVDPDNVRTQALALLNLWVEQSKGYSDSSVGDCGSYSGTRGTYRCIIEVYLHFSLTNSDAQNVHSFRRWRFEMKLSPFTFC